MHSVQFPNGKGAFHFNSDLSGEVKVCIDRSEWEARVNTWDPEDPSMPAFIEVGIPGEAFEAFVERMILYKLGDISEEIADLIIGRLKR